MQQLRVAERSCRTVLKSPSYAYKCCFCFEWKIPSSFAHGSDLWEAWLSVYSCYDCRWQPLNAKFLSCCNVVYVLWRLDGMNIRINPLSVLSCYHSVSSLLFWDLLCIDSLLPCCSTSQLPALQPQQVTLHWTHSLLGSCSRTAAVSRHALEVISPTDRTCGGRDTAEPAVTTTRQQQFEGTSISQSCVCVCVCVLSPILTYPEPLRLFSLFSSLPANLDTRTFSVFCGLETWLYTPLLHALGTLLPKSASWKFVCTLLTLWKSRLKFALNHWRENVSRCFMASPLPGRPRNRPWPVPNSTTCLNNELARELEELALRLKANGEVPRSLGFARVCLAIFSALSCEGCKSNSITPIASDLSWGRQRLEICWRSFHESGKVLQFQFIPVDFVVGGSVFRWKARCP